MSGVRSVSSGPVRTYVETCEIAWWKGYIKGRFEARLRSTSGAPQLVAESPLVRSRGDGLPEPTQAAVRALNALTERLIADGWTAAESPLEEWFQLVFTRPTSAPPVVAKPKEERPPQREPAESAAVARLRSELAQARDEGEREQQLRRQAEQRPRLVVTEPSSEPTAAPARRRPLWIVLEVAAVVAAAVLFLLAGSVYAALVAGLTTGAVCLGVDSFFAARSSRQV